MAKQVSHDTTFKFLASFRKLATDLRARPFLWVGFGLLQFLQVMIFTESVLFPGFSAGNKLFSPNTLMICVELVILLVLGLRCRAGKRVSHGVKTTTVLLLLVIGSVACVVGSMKWPDEQLLSSIILLGGTALFSYGMIVLIIWVCATFGRLGSRLALLYGAGGTLINLLLISLFHASTPPVQAIIFVGASAALPFFLRRSRLGCMPVSSFCGTDQKHRAMPWKLVITAFFQGLSFGLIYYTFPLKTVSASMFVLDMLGFLLAAIFLFVAVGIVRINYNRLIYQFSFPLICLSYLLLALIGSAFELSLVLKNAGYTMLDIVIISLSAYLVYEREASVLTIALWPSAFMLAGHFFGSLIVYLAQSVALVEWKIYFVLVFVLLTAALLLSNNENMKTGWGLVRAGNEASSRSELSLACGMLASNYGLTDRETEVLLLLASGRNKASIADKLTISTGTSKTHITNIYKKVGVHSQQELINLVENAEGMV